MADRTCPGCGKERLCRVEEAEKIYRTGQWGGIIDMLEDASHVCPFCKVVKVDGSWMRMQQINARARELAQASSSKGHSEYVDILTAGDKQIGDEI